MNSDITCDCCRRKARASDCMYDEELEEFVCRGCWPDLCLARRVLLDAGLCQTLGVQMERRFTLPKEPNT